MIEARDERELLFRVPLIEVKNVVTVMPKVAYERRGVYPHANVTITSAAPYGLLRSGRTVNVPGEVLVFPRVYDTASPATVGLDMISGGRFRGARRVNSGAHFAGVRVWQAGDALKQVHWKTSARRGELMVKTFEEELGGRVSLLLDCESSARNEVVDSAVRAAASIAVATLQEGHHLEMITAGDSETLRLPPFSDEAELLGRLARYQPAKAALDIDVSVLWRRSVLALVGTRFRLEWVGLIAQAEQQNRRIHLYLADVTNVPETGAEVWQFSADEVFAPGQKALATA
jgi:uncharacterized protein (DUF58 family)